jgi:hypothetical protein
VPLPAHAEAPEEGSEEETYVPVVLPFPVTPCARRRARARGYGRFRCQRGWRGRCSGPFPG